MTSVKTLSTEVNTFVLNVSKIRVKVLRRRITSPRFLNMVLCDEHGDRIVANVRGEESVKYFAPKLIEGDSVWIQYFQTMAENPESAFRPTKHPFRIEFIRETRVISSHSLLQTFKLTHLSSFEDIIQNNDMTFLVDVVGKIHSVGVLKIVPCLNNATINSIANRLSFQLINQRGIIIQCFLYGPNASMVVNAWNEKGKGDAFVFMRFARILAAEGMTTKITSYSILTHVFVDPSTEEIKQFKREFAWSNLEIDKSHIPKPFTGRDDEQLNYF